MQSGLTVALVGLPQCLAYAIMSGLPPAYGLTTAAIPGLIAAIFGKSGQVITGPTNTTGLLILTALGPYLGAHGLLGHEGLPVLATLTLFVGTLRMILAFGGGASIVDFLPESVLTGFATGAGVLIAAMQLDEALGMSAVSGGNMIAVVGALASKLGHGERPAWLSVLVTIVTVALIAFGRRHRPRLPVALIVVVVFACIAWATKLGTSAGLPLVGDRAPVEAGWPPGALPTFDFYVWRQLTAPAFAIVLIGTLELTVVARGFGARPDMKRELRAQGLANIAGAFTSAFPASASLTRSVLLKLGGAESRVAAGIAAVAVIPLLFLAAPIVRSIPLACLAGVLIITAASMLRIDEIKRMLGFARPTRFLLIVTFSATLTLPLEWAILGGAGLGLVIHLAETTSPRIEIYRVVEGALVPHVFGAPADELVVEVSGPLHYAAIRHFRTDYEAKLPKETKRIVLDLTHAHGMRYAALLALEELNATAKAQGGEVVLAGVPPGFAAMLHQAASKLVMFEYDPLPGRSVQRALRPSSE